MPRDLMARDLRRHRDQIQSWTLQGRTHAWIAYQLEVPVQVIQEFAREHLPPPEDNTPVHRSTTATRPSTSAPSGRSLRPHLNQIRSWVRQGRTDAWIAHQLEVTVQAVQSFKREQDEVDPADVMDAPAALDLAGNPLADSSTLGAVEVSLAEVSDALIAHLAAHPELLHTLHWRKFEELVAELLAREGFDVTLTSASGDRGVDIYALRHEGFGRFLYVVECKRQAPERPVGPGLVRHLFGVVEREKATHGLLATTSSFTKGAVAEQREVEFRVSLRDFMAIRDWLRRS